MARTKQTARKSTGGVAPRRQIAGCSSPPLYYSYGKPPSSQPVIPETPSIPTMVPSSITPSTAQEMVLSTPDLIVIILSQLPHSSLLEAKRVCKAWADLFNHVEIRAALFLHPRPKGSALYVETYSDILTNMFPAFWPKKGKNKASFFQNSDVETFHREERARIVADTSRSHDQSGIRSENTTTPQPPDQQSHRGKCPYSQQWRQLLICQPPIEALEIVHEVNRRGGGTLEFRTIIDRPGGLRMGFLYDALRHWHEVERSHADLLWNRSSGDLTYHNQIYLDSPSFKTIGDKPCVTIWGQTSVGCGQYGGLTYQNYQHVHQAQVIESGDEHVEYVMSEPKLISFDFSLPYPSIGQDSDDQEDEERE